MTTLSTANPPNPIKDRTLNNIAALEAKLRARDPALITQAQKKTLIDQYGQWEEVVKVLAYTGAKAVPHEERQ